MMNKSPGRGRRPGSPDTRAAILAVARRRFLGERYHAVTLRSVADEAGTDVALISYYFGSKRGLFGAALALAENPAEVLTQTLKGDPVTFPQRALRNALALWDDPVSGPALVAVLKTAAQDDAFATAVKDAVEREVIDQLATHLGGRNARKRAAAFCTQILGVIASRYLLRLEPLASMSPDEIVRYLGPSVRQSLSEPLRS
jgi:AcrR family transcriptional regulator